jgi:hypothetical protein
MLEPIKRPREIDTNTRPTAMSKTKSEIETLGKTACASPMTSGDVATQTMNDDRSECTRRLAGPENMFGLGARAGEPGSARGGALVMPHFS